VRVWDWNRRITDYEYDAGHRLTKIERSGNGTQQTRSYNPAGQLTHLQEFDGEGTLIVGYTYTYDAAGNITQETVSPDITQLTDSLPTMDYSLANRLAQVDGQAPVFDADGNMIRTPSGEPLQFDTRNRLVAYKGVEYQFNAENQRVGMRTAEGLTTYVVNPVAALSQTLVKTAPDGSQTYYVYGLGLIAEDGPQGYRTYHYDLRGSTVALADGEGQVVEQFVYSPFGGLVSGDASVTPFLYNGRDGVMTDPNGLYYMRARFYSPELRRFVNQDVLLGFVADGQSLNRYAYVTGNPVSFIDPFGLYAVVLIQDYGKVGHAAIAVKNKKNNQWEYYSLEPDGGAEEFSMLGESFGTEGKVIHESFDSISELAKKHSLYKDFLIIYTSDLEAEAMLDNLNQALEDINSHIESYNLYTNSCVDLVIDALRSGVNIGGLPGHLVIEGALIPNHLIDSIIGGLSPFRKVRSIWRTSNPEDIHLNKNPPDDARVFP